MKGTILISACCLRLLLSTWFSLGAVPQDEVASLFSLYNSTGGDHWWWRTRDVPVPPGPVWNFTTGQDGVYVENPCGGMGGRAWQGVTCSLAAPLCTAQTCHITGISLNKYNLTGVLPSAMRSQYINTLDLSQNLLEGTIPAVMLSALVQLTLLNLEKNSFSGTIPEALSVLTGLVSLDLGFNWLEGSLRADVLCPLSLLESVVLQNNFLNGSIPEQIGCLGSSFTKLDLSNNDLSSTLPASLSALSSLALLNVAFNSLNGSLPDEVYQLTKLVGLSVANNTLQIGSLSPSISNLVSLAEINMVRCGITGQLPEELWLLTNLEVVHMSVNSVTGTLSPAIGNMKQMRTFYIYTNFITGTIPTEIVNMSNLRFLNVANNMINGSIPERLHIMPQLFQIVFGGNDMTGRLPALMPPQLQLLGLSECFFTGPIPSSLLTDAQFSFVWIHGNMLTGPLPAEIGLVETLIDLRVYDNFLTGTIPSQLGALTSIAHIELHNNEFTGTIPGVLSQCLFLHSLSLARNSLTGTLPPIQNLRFLDSLWLFDNSLTGFIPESYGELTSMIYFEMDGNFLTGTIPASLGSLLEVIQLLVFDNHLTGTLPSSLGQLTALQRLFCDGNHLTGQLLPGVLGRMTDLRLLQVSDNMFSGVFPPDIGSLLLLEGMLASHNLFEGSIPAAYAQLPKLETLVLQANVLTGGLGGVFDPGNQKELYMVDLSNNLLTGSLPDALFLLPDIELIVLSVNCFSHELPQSLCSASQTLGVLCLDGLRGAPNCANNFRVPVFDVVLFNTIDGSIPSCVWSFPKLTYLHMAGNGLSGTIPPPPPSTLLSDVVLSHNQLSGTIPPLFQQIPTLDLSFNSFSGHLQFNSSSVATSVSLSVNRLSGVLDAAWLQTVPYLEILESNIFKCGSIPSNDEYYQFYTCESEDLDLALFLMMSTLFVSFAVMVGGVLLTLWPLCCAGSPVVDKLRRVAFRYKTYLYYFRDAARATQLRTHDSRRVVEFVQSLIDASTALMGLIALLLLAGVPIYIVKTLEHFEHQGSMYAFSTFHDTYRWFWTFAYISGVTPAVLILLGWMAVVTAYYCYGVLCLKTFKSSRDEHKRSLSTAQHHSEANYTINKMVTTGFLSLNILINTAVNGIYIYLSLQDHSSATRLTIQMAMAVFKLLYTLIAVPLLASHIPVSTPNVWFRLLLLIINNLFIPCFTVAVESPTCFRGLFFENQEIFAFYSINVCSTYTAILNQKFCTEEIFRTIEIAPLTPPFAYNYQCASAILTAYIPVYMYIYALQIMLPFLYVLLLTLLKYEQFPKWTRALLHAVMWPKHFIKQGQKQGQKQEEQKQEQDQSLNPLHESDVACPLPSHESAQTNAMTVCSTAAAATATSVLVISDPFLLLDSRDIITTDILNHLIVLFSFGFCSPMLTLAVGLSVYLKLNMWVVLLGRFASYFESPQQSRSLIDSVYSALSDTCLSLTLTYHSTLWPLLSSSAVFFGFLCWDLCADEVGWLDAMWVPCVVLAVPCVLWLSGVATGVGRARRSRGEWLAEELQAEEGIRAVEMAVSPHGEEAY